MLYADCSHEEAEACNWGEGTEHPNRVAQARCSAKACKCNITTRHSITVLLMRLRYACLMKALAGYLCRYGVRYRHLLRTVAHTCPWHRPYNSGIPKSTVSSDLHVLEAHNQGLFPQCALNFRFALLLCQALNAGRGVCNSIAMGSSPESLDSLTSLASHAS